MIGPTKRFIARYENALRLAMIVAFAVYVLMSSIFLSYMVAHQDDVCHRANETRLVLREVIEEAYTLRPGEKVPPELAALIRANAEQRERVLSRVPGPESCGLFSSQPPLVVNANIK